MKVNNITITLRDNKDKKFTLDQNDWEGAPDPICMSLITQDSGKRRSNKKRVKNRSKNKGST